MGIFYRSSQTGKNAPGEVHLTLMCENTPPAMKWDKDNGNDLAWQLLHLHQYAEPCTGDEPVVLSFGKVGTLKDIRSSHRHDYYILE